MHSSSLCSVVALVYKHSLRMADDNTSSSSQKFLEWPKQQCHHEDHVRVK